MRIYYFAVDYQKKLQMWAPNNWSDKCIWYPGHPLPCMVAFMNCNKSFNFEFVNDMSTYEEHVFKNVTDEVYQEWQDEFKNYDWKEFEKDR